MEEEWLTTGEVAERLGYSVPWVREQINRGRLPAREFRNRERRSLRIHRRDLDRFVRCWLRPAQSITD
jgi:excisionase family DNA binding protein